MVNIKLTELEPILKHMNLSIWQEIVYSKAASIALYGQELFTGQSQLVQIRFTFIIMHCYRAIFCYHYFMVSNGWICEEIVDDPP